MSRFDRLSCISARMRYGMLLRRAYRSAGVTVLALWAFAVGLCLWSRESRSVGDGEKVGFSFPVADAGVLAAERPVFPAVEAVPPLPEPEWAMESFRPVEPVSLDSLPPDPWIPPLDSPGFFPLPQELGNKAIAPSSREKEAQEEPAHPAASAPHATARGGNSSDFVPPAYRSASKPPYPPSLRLRRIEGSLRVRIQVSDEGKPVQVELLESSGHGEFDQSAREWILRHWSFSPARLGGEAVPSTVVTSVHYSLNS